MDDQLWPRADALLVLALELPTGEREAFVEQETAGDEELAALVLRLLHHAEDPPGDLAPGLRLSAAPAGLLSPTLVTSQAPVESEASACPPGTVVGRYRVLGELGRGGMAVVYRAERVDGTFEQQVALKRLRSAAPSREVIRRLEQERQILARATHPDLARLLDGGVDVHGHPYLVMELVDGVPIDTYCDAHRLTVDQRLELFLRVARAVAYAHSNLVIHRDIKPSNILVTADGHPKLLDFGIARILAESPEDLATALTREGGPMTPAYASPEQVRAEPVTTHSDTYQLGLLLYLLVCGRTPFGGRRSSPLELARAISDEAPPPPRQAFWNPVGDGPEGDTVATREKIARYRGTTPQSLARRLDGDLGAIVLMALRKEPQRRYASVALLVDDVERHRAGHTVKARPDSLGYRLRTFTRRHRAAVVLGALLLLALTLFATVAAMQAQRIAAERDRANREAEIASEVATFLTGLFRVSDPSEALGNTITAREILDRGRGEIDERMPEPTLVRARLKRTMAEVYENLGLYGEALPLLQEAVETAGGVGGEAHPETADGQAQLAGLHQRMGHYDEAEGLNRKALEIRRRSLGEDHPKTLDVYSNLANLKIYAGDYGAAEKSLRQLLANRRRVQGPDHPDSLGTATNLAASLFYQGKMEEVEEFYRQVYDGSLRTFGADHPRTLVAASNLGSVWVQLRNFEEAEPLLRDTIERRRRVLGPKHLATLSAETNLAGLLLDTGRLDEAEVLYHRIHGEHLRQLGAEHPGTLNALYDLALVLSEDPARRDQAAELYRQVVAGYRSLHGPEHPFAVATLYRLAVLEAEQGHSAAALEHLKDAVDHGLGGTDAGADLLAESALDDALPAAELARLRDVVARRLSED